MDTPDVRRVLQQRAANAEWVVILRVRQPEHVNVLRTRLRVLQFQGQLLK